MSSPVSEVDGLGQIYTNAKDALELVTISSQDWTNRINGDGTYKVW